uniref:high affinity copper uptake protein 1-like n=1 Tax=Styela clava TaxID=7725 RepID=UPI00193A75E2|nr:high affinity copper uptake protein 1-like [Styela clava]
MAGTVVEHNMHNMTATIMNTTMNMIMNNMTMPSGGNMGHHMHGMNGTMAPMSNSTETMGHGHHMHDADTSMTMDPNPMGHNGHMHGTQNPGMTGGMGHEGHSMHDTAGGHHGGSGGVYFDFPLPLHILFYGWEVTTQGELAGACVAVLVLSIVYEGLKSLRENLLCKVAKNERRHLLKSAVNELSEGTKIKSPERTCVQKIFNWWHILFSFMQVIQTTLGMFLMLIYMTFNVWLAVSVSLGSGLGYFLFAWNKRHVSEFDDHCG